MSIKWSREQTVRFVGAYEKCRCLWDPNDPYYTKRPARERALCHLVTVMTDVPDFDVEGARRKVKIIRGTYWNDRKKLAMAKRDGMPFKPVRWYNVAHKFLKDVVTLNTRPRKSIKSAIPLANWTLTMPDKPKNPTWVEPPRVEVEDFFEEHPEVIKIELNSDCSDSEQTDKTESFSNTHSIFKLEPSVQTLSMLPALTVSKRPNNTPPPSKATPKLQRRPGERTNRNICRKSTSLPTMPPSIEVTKRPSVSISCDSDSEQETTANNNPPVDNFTLITNRTPEMYTNNHKKGHQVVNNLKIQKIGNNSKVDNEFDIFGKSVAKQLQQMPLEDALEVQFQINRLISQRRLAILKKPQNETNSANFAKRSRLDN